MLQLALARSLLRAEELLALTKEAEILSPEQISYAVDGVEEISQSATDNQQVNITGTNNQPQSMLKMCLWIIPGLA